MRWMAVLICLLPELDAPSRPAVEPDHCGIGARPPYRAKALSVLVAVARFVLTVVRNGLIPAIVPGQVVFIARVATELALIGFEGKKTPRRAHVPILTDTGPV